MVMVKCSGENCKIYASLGNLIDYNLWPRFLTHKISEQACYVFFLNMEATVFSTRSKLTPHLWKGGSCDMTTAWCSIKETYTWNSNGTEIHQCIDHCSLFIQTKYFCQSCYSHFYHSTKEFGNSVFHTGTRTDDPDSSSSEESDIETHFSSSEEEQVLEVPKQSSNYVSFQVRSHKILWGNNPSLRTDIQMY